MHRIADIETQSLNWKKAVQLYNQICTLQPNDYKAYRNLVSLLFSLEESEKAFASIDEFTSYLEASGDSERQTQFLNEIVADQPDEAMIHYRLAAANQKITNISEAVKLWVQLEFQASLE